MVDSGVFSPSLIDVLLGIATAIVGVLILEKLLLSGKAGKTFIDRYTKLISWG